MTILGVASGGGHLTQLLCLLNEEDETTKIVVSGHVLESDDSRILPLPPYSGRNPFSLLRVLIRTFIIVLQVRPTIVISTGAEAAIPFFYFSKLFGAKTIYVESSARVSSPSMTGASAE